MKSREILDESKIIKPKDLREGAAATRALLRLGCKPRGEVKDEKGQEYVVFKLPRR